MLPTITMGAIVNNAPAGMPAARWMGWGLAWIFAVLVTVSGVHSDPGPSFAQDLTDRPISSIQFEGLNRVSEQEVLNNIRSAVGESFDPDVTRTDVRRLTRLGEFQFIDVQAELQGDSSVSVTFMVVEQPIVTEVQVVGNRRISDQELRAAVPILQRGPRDEFLIEQSKRSISTLYRKKGHYLTSVEIDEAELDETGILIFRIVEGPRVRVRAIEFEGNTAFDAKLIRSEIKTRTAVPLFRRGELDTDILTNDVSAIDSFYKDRGYLDVRIDRRIDLSPDNTEAKVVFLIDEGKRYTLRSVRTAQSDGSALSVYSDEQVAAILEIKTGDVYSRDRLRKSVRILRDSYLQLGYLDVQVRPSEFRPGEGPNVDLYVEINEGRQYRVGNIDIQGNFLSKDKIIRREMTLKPGRPFDGTQIEKADRRLRNLRLFSNRRLTIQDADPGSDYRDLLVQVRETNTGAVNFGVAFGTDSGALGEISINQRNFDVTDLPESFKELVRGRAFRGGGQNFNATLRPGNELFLYSMSLTEPRFLDSNFSLSGNFTYFQRFRSDYDEQRLQTSVSLGRRFGDIWSAALRARLQQVELDNIITSAPTEIFQDAGPDTLTALELSITRTTADNRTRPSEGSRLELLLSQTGILGGDFDYATASVEYTVFLTLNEDFLGRKSILRLRSQVSNIFGNDAPSYEQFYLGGRSFRGFEFREISPKGIRNDNGLPSDEPVGGEWMVFLGAQYEVPLVEETITGVMFVDSGTVTDSVGLDDYRMSVGAGLRLYIPQLGPIPIALDFATPVFSEETDQETVFSFSADIPF